MILFVPYIEDQLQGYELQNSRYKILYIPFSTGWYDELEWSVIIVVNAHLATSSNCKELVMLSFRGHSVMVEKVRAPAIAIYITKGMALASCGWKALKTLISVRCRLLVPNDSNFGIAPTNGESGSESGSSARDSDCKVLEDPWPWIVGYPELLPATCWWASWYSAVCHCSGTPVNWCKLICPVRCWEISDCKPVSENMWGNCVLTIRWGRNFDRWKE